MPLRGAIAGVLSRASVLLRTAVLRWAVFMSVCVVVHYVLEPLHHRHCRRSIFHVMFWKKSQFCSTLESMLQHIENMFECLHGGLMKRVADALDVSRVLYPTEPNAAPAYSQYTTNTMPF